MDLYDEMVEETPRVKQLWQKLRDYVFSEVKR